MGKYRSYFLDRALEFIESLPTLDQAKISASISVLETDFSSVFTKTLKSPLRELIVKKYRLLFFIKESKIYFICGFVKKSQKTPKSEIEYALDITRLL